MNETRTAETELVVHWVPTLGKLVPLADAPALQVTAQRD
jgi:hypothetical protein